MNDDVPEGPQRPIKKGGPKGERIKPGSGTIHKSARGDNDPIWLLWLPVLLALATYGLLLLGIFVLGVSP